MTTNEFREFQFYDNINPEILEYIFESAWNTLTKLYPNIKLDSSDCFSIYVIPDTIEDDNTSNNDLVYVTGLFNGHPAIQNLGTKEIIQIKMNRKHSNKCTFYTLRFGCSFAVANTIKPQLL